MSPVLEYVPYRENDHGTEAFWPFVREQVWHFAPGPTWFFAVEPIPAPAELKLLAVPVAGVAGSFGLTALARRRILDHRGEALADADAHRGDSVAGAAAA